MVPRPIPQKDPEAVADLVRRAKEARLQLSDIVRQIEDLVVVYYKKARRSREIAEA